MTIIYNVPVGGDSSAQLDSAASLRYGIQLNGATGGLVGKSISTFVVYLRKVTTPSGNVTATVRNSADTVRATFQESIVATSLSTTSSPVTFTLASPITLANGDRIQVEYSGNAGVRIEIYTTDQYDGALTRRTRFQSAAYTESSTTDIVGTITDGTFFSQTFTHKYNIRQLATQTFTHKYNIRRLASQTYTHLYKIRQLAGKTFTHKYNIRQLASKIYTHKYNIRKLVNRTFTHAYKILELAIIPSPSLHSFTALSFTSTSFTVFPVPVITTPSKPTRNRFRSWIQSLARDFKGLFKIKPTPPPPEDVEIPPAQPPKIFHLLPSPPTLSTKLETLNDKWTSVVASVPPAEARTEIIYYPLIIHPETSPLIQNKVTFPPNLATKQPILSPPILADGSHIESVNLHFPGPKKVSKTASTINTLMILLEIERQV